MKNLFKLLLLVMSMSLFTISCSDNNDIEETIFSNSNDSLSGEWAWSREIFGDLEDDYFKDLGIDAVGFSFNANKTGVLITNGAFIKMTLRSFKYKYNEKKGKISIVFDDDKEPKSMTFDIAIGGGNNCRMELKCTSDNFLDLLLIGAEIK